MPTYEYKIVPAPRRARRIRGLRGEDLFARTLEEAMGALGRDGWQFLRAETLPHEERRGLLRRVETARIVLVFQREIPTEAEIRAAAAAAQAQATPPPQAAAAPRPETLADDPPDNLWQDPEDEPELDLARALFPNRQR